MAGQADGLSRDGISQDSLPCPQESGVFIYWGGVSYAIWAHGTAVDTVSVLLRKLLMV